MDAAYYISRVLIPPLERIFNLVGADVRSWFDEMPRTLHVDELDLALSPSKEKAIAVEDAFKIDDHFMSSRCMICNVLTPEGKCLSLFVDSRSHGMTT